MRQANNFGNSGTSKATEEFKVSMEAYQHTDFKYGLCFNYYLSQTKPEAKMSFWVT